MHPLETITTKTLSYASPKRRFAASFIDGLLASLIIGIFSFAITFLIGKIALHFNQEFFQSFITPQSDLFQKYIKILSIGIVCLSCMVSSCFFTSRWRATPGMRLMSCQIVNSNLETLSFKRAFMRSAVKNLYVSILYEGSMNLHYITWKFPENISLFWIACLAILIASLVYIFFIFFNKKRQTLHDYVAGTYVVHGLPKQPFRKSKNIVIETESV